MKTIKIALVGQPNVGKSQLINAISGAHLHVGNFAGVTVEYKKVEFTRGDYRIEMIDLPGLYSLETYTPEEEVTKSYLLNESYDLIINVVDANTIARNLNLTLQLCRLGKKMVVAFNMYDEVVKLGGAIYTERFRDITGIAAVNTSAKEKENIDALFTAAIGAYNDLDYRCKLSYDERIEEEAEAIAKILEKENFPLPARFIAIRLLQEDRDIYRMVHDRPIFLEVHEPLQKAMERLKIEFDEENVKDLFADERVALAKGIVHQILKAPKRETLTDRIDNILIHPVLGLPLFLLFMYTIFWLTFEMGSIPMDYIDETFGNISEAVGAILPEGFLSKAIVEGIIPAVGAVVMFLPNILILFFGINILEQTGYMARAAYVMDGILKKFGLQGKSFIPLVSGFGCTVPAYMAARTLKNPKDRLITMLVLGFMSCGARLPVYVLLVGAFFAPEVQANVMFGIYIGGAFLGLVTAKVLRLTLFKGEPEPFVMEMPKYRFPSLKALGLDLWIKTKMYLKKAGTFIAAAAFIIWFLSSYPVDDTAVADFEKKIELAQSDEQKSAVETEMNAYILEHSYLADMGRAIEPVLAPIGFDWKMSVAAISGLAAKEVVVSTLAVLYHTSDEDENLGDVIKANISFAAAISMIIMIMIYSPCLAAMSTFYAEIPQWAWRSFYTVYPNVLAWILAFVSYHILI
ncbi:ferrous iron transport protein B [Hydrogenimonas cancrithermarum]|uniref:Ferrous iron transport protein B n=1 Tax=Hydrogenimonas cancrithermarum TaxID=2993563 RepID=A0ABM8FMU9_9BACT|nr:ferrous iron transport protein B [Hydrogenimonas cancrithermarum]BDY13075.1 ferrous iron transport protein B [Hydrogenimonas cancrithermarum]